MTIKENQFGIYAKSNQTDTHSWAIKTRQQKTNVNTIHKHAGDVNGN